MKFLYLSIFSALLSTTASAQINLDKPVMIGLGDYVFEAANESNWYYFFPKTLCRTSVPEIQSQGSRLFADFNVRYCDSQIDQIKSELAQIGIQNPNIRVSKGVNTKVFAMSLNDLYGSFDPKVEVLGDAGIFHENVPYRISLSTNSHWGGYRKAKRIMNTLFGPDSVDAFVQIQYFFTSIFAGQLRETSSAVSVYMGRGPSLNEPELEDKLFGLNVSENVIQENIHTGCWNNPKPGIICLK